MYLPFAIWLCLVLAGGAVSGCFFSVLLENLFSQCTPVCKHFCNTHTLVVVFGYVALWPRSTLDTGSASCLFCATGYIVSFLHQLDMAHCGRGCSQSRDRTQKTPVRRLQTGSSEPHLCWLPPLRELLGGYLALCSTWRWCQIDPFLPPCTKFKSK